MAKKRRGHKSTERSQELEEMAAKLLATARELPPGQERHEVLQEIGKFRLQITALQGPDMPQHRWLKAKENRLFDPTPELPDDTPIGDVELSPRIRRILAAWGLKTVGEVRQSSDERLFSLPKLGPRSVAYLRQTLGMPSIDGVRPMGKKPA
jgi:hypothetical protein